MLGFLMVIGHIYCGLEAVLALALLRVLQAHRVRFTHGEFWLAFAYLALHFTFFGFLWWV